MLAVLEPSSFVGGGIGSWGQCVFSTDGWQCHGGSDVRGGAVMCAGAVMLVGAERCWNRRLAVLEPGVGGVGTVGWRCWNRVVLQGAELDPGDSVSSG
jgi:hypothetical protein